MVSFPKTDIKMWFETLLYTRSWVRVKSTFTQIVCNNVFRALCVIFTETFARYLRDNHCFISMSWVMAWEETFIFKLPEYIHNRALLMSRQFLVIIWTEYSPPPPLSLWNERRESLLCKASCLLNSCIIATINDGMKLCDHYWNIFHIIIVTRGTSHSHY